MKVIYALRFLTVLPIPWKKDESLQQMARSSAFFPFVGLILGGLLCLIHLLSSFLWSAAAVNAIILAVWILFTGGLHLDGLADTADGILGGSNREKRLEIMKDSRIGSFGAIALIGIILLKFVFLLEIDPHSIRSALIMAPVTGRWILVLFIFLFPAARKEGMAFFFKQHIRLQEFLIALITILAACVIVYIYYGFWGPVIILVSAGLSIIPALILKSVLGGLTGDTYGALCEISELFVLVLVSLNLPKLLL